MFRFVRMTTCLLSLSTVLHAAPPDINNLNNCINEVRLANANPPVVQTFDVYASNYRLLLSDLQAAIPRLPFVYQEAAAKPLINFLVGLGEQRYLQIFLGQPRGAQGATIKEMLPDVALAVLLYDSVPANAFQEVVSDLYNSFLSNSARASDQGGVPIEPPTYGVIPPLVKFGNAAYGPYTWPANATAQVLGLKCGVVSLPPAQMKGGIFAWSSLGHETGGHDVTHADRGLLDELAQKVYIGILTRFRSPALANYWARCISEATADVLGYVNFGPSAGISLIGYFRSLGNGRLRTVGATDDTHPIDLLRGYLAAAVVKKLGFKDAAAWSQTIFSETQKDNGHLYFAGRNGIYIPFPVGFNDAIASCDVVAEVILKSKLASLQNYSLIEIDDWTDVDQGFVDSLFFALNTQGILPANLQGPGFYASYVVAAATQSALQSFGNLPSIFDSMLNYLATMHFQNPTWSVNPTLPAIALLDYTSTGNEYENHAGKQMAYYDTVLDNDLEADEQIAVDDTSLTEDSKTEELAAG